MPSALQLDRRLRWTVYGFFLVLFASGAAWLPANSLKDSESGEFWQAMSANLLMIHGGVAMIVLVLLGALIPIHMRRSWRRKRNRMTGIVMAVLNALLIVTAFGLYYAGTDAVRGWTSDAHIALGLAFPVLIVAHIWIGRAMRAPSER